MIHVTKFTSDTLSAVWDNPGSSQVFSNSVFKSEKEVKQGPHSAIFKFVNDMWQRAVQESLLQMLHDRESHLKGKTMRFKSHQHKNQDKYQKAN